MVGNDWLNKYEIEKDIYLIHGDYFKIICEMPDYLFNIIITDPPFNAGKNFANDNHPSEKWKDFCNNFVNSLRRPQPKNILIEVSKKDKIMRQELDKYFKYRYAICLNYTNSMRQGTIGYHNWGLVLWYGEGKCYKRYMDRIDSALHNTKKEFAHPSPKEITHYKKLIEMFSQEGDTILDPFMGSGTTGVACAELGRSFIGIEIDKGYFEIAKKRIEQAKSQSQFNF